MKKTLVFLVAALCAAMLCGCMTMEGLYDNNGAAVDADAMTASGSFVAQLEQKTRTTADEIAVQQAKAGAVLTYDEAHPILLRRVDDIADVVTVSAADVTLYDFVPYNAETDTFATCRIRVNFRGLKVGKTYEVVLSGSSLFFQATPESARISIPLTSIDGDSKFTVTAAENPGRDDPDEEEEPETANREIAPQVFEIKPAAPEEEPEVDEATEEEPAQEPGDDLVVSPWPEGEPFDEAFGVDPEQSVPRTGDGAAPVVLTAAAVAAALLALGCGCKKSAW